MWRSAEFLQSIVDSLTEHIVVIDEFGKILFVNVAWTKFGKANRCTFEEWTGVNYLGCCDSGIANGDSYSKLAADGIRKIIAKDLGVFSLEYPCHSPTVNRWFTMTVTPLQWTGASSFVICHRDITDRKLAEEKVINLSLTDSLTDLPNRRHFDNFLRDQWLRAARENSTVSLILADVDQFKLFNDGYGHRAGDDCLTKIGRVVASFAKRPGDIAARYGGEEFAIVLGGAGAEASMKMAQELREAIRNLKIAHAYSVVDSMVTASLGVASLISHKHLTSDSLINAADKALYKAKQGGRNRVCAAEG